MTNPNILTKVLPSGRKLIRFANFHDVFQYDDPEFNQIGLGMHNKQTVENEDYFKTRHVLTDWKTKIIQQAQKEMEFDKDFLSLVYKGKSLKRERTLTKFGGMLSMPHYVCQEEKFFHKLNAGAKKQTLNLAFQVGVFRNSNYQKAFVSIVKTILMCQALNISLNIDMFDSDTTALRSKGGYIIVNVSKSAEKLNFRQLLTAAHSSFFYYTLFNAYSAYGSDLDSIGSFLPQEAILADLSESYDIIGGNLLRQPDEMVSKVIKIGLHELSTRN